MSQTDFIQLQRGVEFLSVRANELVEASDIIKSQLVNRNHIWVTSLVKQNIGQDASSLVADVRWAESTGRTRSVTWARNPQEARRSRNLMGYRLRHTRSELNDGDTTRSQ